jgi:myo-inositol catabolism protein IolC
MPKERKFVWPDAGPLDLDKSVRRINKQYLEFPKDQITEFFVFWIRSLYVPEGCSDSQMEELETLTERWVADLGMAEN